MKKFKNYLILFVMLSVVSICIVATVFIDSLDKIVL